MPFKSEAQRRKMHELEKQGKLKKGTAKAWAAETPKGKKLPERVTAPKSPKSLEDLKKMREKKYGK
jgi:hypothetical protein